MVRMPNQAATGMVASNSARLTSAAMSTGPRRHRSSQAPAGNPISANAIVEAAASRPTSNEEACNIPTASSGIATPLTCVPSWAVVCPASRSRKSWEENSEGEDMSTFRMEG